MVTTLHVFRHAVGSLFLGIAARVYVDRRGFACSATQQVVDRHVRHLALDVPQRLVNSRQRIVQYRTVAPVGGDVCTLPDVFDICHVASHQERREIVIHRGLDRGGTLRESSASDAV